MGDKGGASTFSLDMKSEMSVTHLIVRQGKQGSRCADVGLAKWSLQAVSPRVPETGKHEKYSEEERWPSMCPEELSHGEVRQKGRLRKSRGTQVPGGQER